MTEHSYRLRKTQPDEDDDWLVIDEEDVLIARIFQHKGSSPRRWFFSVWAFDLPQGGGFSGYEDTQEEAQERVKELWPVYRRQWSEASYEAARARHRAMEERERQREARMAAMQNIRR